MPADAADFSLLVSGALADLQRALGKVDQAGVAAAVDAIASARRVVCTGVGREGLMMRALAMRLYHLGLGAHVVGDMGCPPIGAGDLLVVSAGPGDFSTIAALVGVAKAADARVLCVTAQPGGPVPQAADLVLHLPAQTMADDGPQAETVLPMGSLFEGAQFVAFEALVLMLRERLDVSADAMRARHTNLE